jgi:cytochrome c oxidase subunit IV
VASPESGHAEPNYMGVFWALLILTLVELAVAYLHLPRLLSIISLCALALAKAGLVAAYFMHLKFEKYALILIVLSPLVLSAILYVGLVPDAITHIRWLPQ